MPKQKKTKTVKAWGVVRRKGFNLETEKTRKYLFEIEKKLEPQNIILVFKSKLMANRWKRKWADNFILKVIPITITYKI